MRNPTKIALAGIAGYGDFYLHALLSGELGPGINLVGVVDQFPHRCGRLGELRARQVPVHSTLDQVFARTSVDLLIIATPIQLHARQTCFALQHGANVLCEKPLAGSLGDALAMAECERKSNKFVAIGFQWSFSRAIQLLKHDVMSGALGRPMRLKTMAFFPRSRRYFSRNDWAGRIRTEAGDAVLDSPVNNATAHYLHNMLYVLGRKREQSAAPISVQAELYRANEIENYDTAAMRVIADGGTELLFFTTHAVTDRLGPRCVFEFENAVVEFDANGAAEFVARFSDGRLKSYGAPGIDGARKLSDSIQAARGGAPIACGIRAALAHTQCVTAAQESPPSIGEIPARLRQTIVKDGEQMICVDGLAEALMECYEQAILPAEHGGFSWAHPGATIGLGLPPVRVSAAAGANAHSVARSQLHATFAPAR